MSDGYVCMRKQRGLYMHKGVWGHSLPGVVFLFLISSSEIISEAILGQKESHSRYIAHRILHPVLAVSCPCMEIC